MVKRKNKGNGVILDKVDLILAMVLAMIIAFLEALLPTVFYNEAVGTELAYSLFVTCLIFNALLNFGLTFSIMKSALNK